MVIVRNGDLGNQTRISGDGIFFCSCFAKGWRVASSFGGLRIRLLIKEQQKVGSKGWGWFGVFFGGGWQNSTCCCNYVVLIVSYILWYRIRRSMTHEPRGGFKLPYLLWNHVFHDQTSPDLPNKYLNLAPIFEHFCNKDQWDWHRSVMAGMMKERSQIWG